MIIFLAIPRGAGAAFSDLWPALVELCFDFLVVYMILGRRCLQRDCIAIIRAYADPETPISLYISDIP